MGDESVTALDRPAVLFGGSGPVAVEALSRKAASAPIDGQAPLARASGAAVWPTGRSYSLPGKAGNIYRFDGWTKVREVKPSSPGKGSTWAKPSASDAIGNGRKSLWVFHPDNDGGPK